MVGINIIVYTLSWSNSLNWCNILAAIEQLKVDV